MAVNRALLALLVWSSATVALAHKPSDSYLRVAAHEDLISIQWDIALKDLEILIGLDANRDSQITWGEVKARRQDIAAHALSRLRLQAGGRDCQLSVADMLITQHSDGAYAVLDVRTDCPASAGVISIDYQLLFDLDPTHRGLVLYDDGARVATHILSPGNSTVELTAGEGGLWSTFADYLVEGIWHIWIGYDHILFLLSLLLPAVLKRQQRVWQPVNSFLPACKAVLKIVTVFTLAHSITLWLAVMEYVKLPASLVEATIALSIVVTALNNLFPVLPISGWAIAFVFGLVHGFGFANVLLDLGLSDAALAVSLLAFNVGVELGQIAIVMAFLPIAYALRRTTFYRWCVLGAGSVAVAVMGAIWFVERAFDLAILPQ